MLLNVTAFKIQRWFGICKCFLLQKEILGYRAFAWVQRGKYIFSQPVSYFSVLCNIFIYKFLKPHLCAHFTFTGISTLLMWLTGVSFARSQMSLRKVGISPLMKNSGWKIISKQLKQVLGNPALFKLVVPVQWSFFFFSWVFPSIVQEMYDVWDATFIYTHRPWELYKRSYPNRIEEQLATHVQQRRKMWQLQFSQQTESLDLVSAHLWNHALWTLLWQGKTRFFFPPVKLNVTLDSIISETSSFQVHTNTLHRKLNSLSVYWVDNAVFECVRTPARWEIKEEAL